MRLSHFLFAASLTAFIAGCAVGPDFERPSTPGGSNYDSQNLPAQTTATEDNASGTAQKFASGEDIPAEWWTLFHSEPLNQLIDQALKSNPDLQAAQASLRVAGENTAVGEGLLYPTVNGSFNTTRQKTSGAGFGGEFPGFLYTLHNASVSASYGIDLWGASRREIEQLGAEEDYQRFQLEATYITLTANVVTTAIQEASLRGQIAATKHIIEEEGKQVDILQQQLDLGAIAKSAVLAEVANAQQTKATLPGLEQQLAQIRHQLSALLGHVPSEEPQAKFDLSSLQLPTDLPVSLPSKLVEQRPDVRAAEANLHAASAAIGVAEAARLPQITLDASIGDESNNLGKMFLPGTGIWSAGFNAAQTLFDAGTLKHQQNAAEATYDVAAAQYRKTVIAAFQDVADVLRALQADADTLKEQTAAEQAASESLKLTQDQFDAGSISYINLLSAQQIETQAKLALVQAEANRYADTAALFHALGGGWWNRPADKDIKPKSSSWTDFFVP